MDALYLTCNVRYRIVDGRAVLLDLSAGKYVIFDQVATAMWRTLLSAGTRQEGVRRLTEEFDAPAASLESDLSEFARVCLQRGYLQREAPRHRKSYQPLSVHKTALTLRAWWSLLLTSRTLAKEGFARTYEAYSGFAQPSAAAAESHALISRAERAFRRAENFFLLRKAPRDCLPRSLALYRFLLSAGIPAEHVIGIQMYPFQAHAWVECQGLVLCDMRDHVSCFSELARI